MLIFTKSLRICLAVEPCDLRASFEKLAVLVKERLGEDERSSQVFVFGNRRKNRVKMLYWDGTGLWILTKKLEAGTYSWPTSSEAGKTKLSLRSEALEMLLSGIDLKGAKLRPWYESER
jgi:transposase